MSRGLQWILGICAVVVALAVLFALIGPWVLPQTFGRVSGTGMMGGYGQGMMGGGGMGGYGRGSASGQGIFGGGMIGGYGMMPGTGSGLAPTTGQRISIDQARSVAEQYAAAISGDLAVAEVMEFEDNFYAVIEETSSGRGAMEVLVDPFAGVVGPEPGPNMMWNDKYGHMAFGAVADNQLSMEQAREYAQQALQGQLPGSTVHEDGTEFYGYYTFDFDGPDGAVAGMLSVEAQSGAVWLHTWHGAFVAEWEAESAGS